MMLWLLLFRLLIRKNLTVWILLWRLVSLVKTPQIDSIYDKYIKLGHELKDSEIIKKLLCRINSLEEQGKMLSASRSEDALPFIFLDGSSGMGKTQTAFTLMWRGDLKVHYLVCTVPKGAETATPQQVIYNRIYLCLVSKCG